MKCPKCLQQFEGAVCPNCQVPVAEQTAGVNPYAVPIPIKQTTHPYENALPPRDEEGDGTGGVIPYKNPKALIAYYLGIVSGLPLIGLPFGIAAFVLGILGLKARKRNPVIKGSAHAWIGIGCGGFFALFWGLILAVSIASLFFAPQ